MLLKFNRYYFTKTGELVYCPRQIPRNDGARGPRVTLEKVSPRGFESSFNQCIDTTKSRNPADRFCHKEAYVAED